MITIANASVYSVNKGTELAYELAYSDGTVVRAVDSSKGTIRKEFLCKGEWKLVGKPYVVTHNKKRAAEVLKETVKKQFTAAA